MLAIGIAVVEPVQFQCTPILLFHVFKFCVLCRSSSRSVWGDYTGEVYDHVLKK